MIVQTLISAGLLLFLGWSLIYFVFGRLILRLLTGGKIKSRHLMHYEVWDEIWAELKARRLVAKARRNGEL